MKKEKLAFNFWYCALWFRKYGTLGFFKWSFLHVNCC